MADVAQSDMVTLTIDGRELEAIKGELLIEAAQRAGVFVPRFCYHPRMKPVGMCRMCLVEVTGPRGASLQPACFVEVADGQLVETGSTAAVKAQQGVLEFLLVNHPLDCPVCDKGGECPLQDQAMSHGPGESRYVEEKRHFAKPTLLGPLTLLDRERCIQCARCTRFAEEVAGEPLIDFYSRGDEIEVAVFPDRPFTSYFSGNTVQICPVGALTSVPYRFASRPWDLEQVETTCTFCSVGCKVVAQSSAGKLVRFLGIDSEPVNQSWLCDRGRYGFESVHSARRLAVPSVLRDGKREEVSWSEALGEVAAGIRQALSSQGPAAVGIIGGARLANEDQYAWSKLARTVIGTDNLDAQLGDGLSAELVSSLPQATIPDAVSASAVILLTGDLREELPVLHLRLRSAAAHEGLKLVDCSLLPSSLGDVATAHVPALPGSEEAVISALLTRQGEPPPGTDAKQLEAARALLTGLDGSEVVIVIGRTSLASSPEQLAAAAAAAVRERPGIRFLPALRRANVRGAIDMGLAPGMLPGRVTAKRGEAFFEEQWGSLPKSPGLGTREMLEGAAAGTIRMLVLLGADPLADFPDRKLATEALEKVPFLVAVDTIASASSRLADVLLPAAGMAERGGTTTNLEGRVTRLAKKIVAPGTAREDWVIAAELAVELGYDLGFESVEEIWSEIEQLAPSHRGATVAAVYGASASDGVLIPLRSVGLTRRRLDPIATPGIDSVITQGAPLFAGAAVLPGGGVATSLEIEQVARSGELPVRSDEEPSGAPRPEPESFDASRWPTVEVPRPDSYSQLLVTRRFLYDQGTLVQAASSLAPLAPAPQIYLSSREAERLGLADGDEVRLKSPRGELVGPVKVETGLPAGVVAVGHNLAEIDEPGASVLIDADEHVQIVRAETVS